MSHPDPNNIHKIDPEGEVVLTLKNPNAPFAVWPTDESDPARQLLGPSRVDNTKEVQFLLSSKHLALNSKYFYKLLNGPWKETCGNEEGPLRLTAEDWDEEALLIVMRVLHASRVPREMNLELLAKIALIVDYYECHDSFFFHVDAWLSQMMSQMNGRPPTELGRAALLWLHVSWVFKNNSYYSEILNSIQTQATGPIPSLGLPIPERDFDSIEELRIQHVGRKLSKVQGDMDLLIGDNGPCTFECSSIHLGSLIKDLSRHGLYPLPKAPYSGVSMNKIDVVLNGLLKPQWATLRSPNNDMRGMGFRVVDCAYRDGYHPTTANVRPAPSTEMQNEPQYGAYGTTGQLWWQ
ncbi:hypothetical protein B0T10DRAFT_604066 [Thelonectria olida]|uniref:BTB domain-containing protein n=1 Tax=Thelonectria olida TaxID=1576542 RepID=A0A9P9ASL8_9HYPO|nr:hypothetical protein B0T10DRAFT_604066 [Thelonectria olida]